MASLLEEILARLEKAERRIAQLEASVARMSPPASAAGSPARPAAVAQAPATAATPVPAAAPAPPPATKPDPAPAPAPAKAPPSTVTLEVPLPTPDITQRLSPLEPEVEAQPEGLLPFPDLSHMDEKLFVPRAPAQKLNTVAYIEEYPRICERILQLWGTPECEGYLNSLIIDTRGNRKGFPPGVMEELLYLGRLARALVIMKVGGDLWSTYDQVGDRR